MDTPFSQSRITLKSTWVDANQFVGLLEQLEPKVDQLFGGEISFTLTGLIPMMVKTITFVMEGMMISYLIAGFVITLLMIVLLASLKLGLWSMIPNFLPILVGLGLWECWDCLWTRCRFWWAASQSAWLSMIPFISCITSGVIT